MLCLHLLCFVILFTNCSLGQKQMNNDMFVRRLPVPLQKPVKKIHETLIRSRELMKQHMNLRKEICYDTVGCFNLPRKHPGLKRIPEDPNVLETKFYLFTRNTNFSTPEILSYNDDLTSLKLSKFNPNNKLKLIIHGFMTTWNQPGALQAMKAYLQIGDYNAILVDWHKGAQGPQYSMAAANTEVVGRQLGLLLLDMIGMGLNHKDIHLIGFSLGAHIAGCASEMLKKSGYLIGRITGLDAASPLFKHNLVTDKSKKLDLSDAHFVDVIHTDGSPIFTDGFGILEPIGHVDFFPNGGREQPGCNDRRGSVVVSHFDKLNTDIACSHIRAWSYFLESIIQKTNKSDCQFTSYPCKNGLLSYTQGNCFIIDDTATYNHNYKQYGNLGEDVKGLGPMYLVTRNSSPYCGTQLQASVRVSQMTQRTRGILQLRLRHGNSTTNFHINCELLDIVPIGHYMYGLAAAEFNTISPNGTKKLQAELSYQSLEFQSPVNITTQPALYIDEVKIQDLKGSTWKYIGPNTKIDEHTIDRFNILTVELNLQ